MLDKEQRVADKLTKLLEGSNKFSFNGSKLTYVNNRGYDITIAVIETPIETLRKMFVFVDHPRSAVQSNVLFAKVVEEVEYDIQRGR